jgi:DNA polymerase III sliding clamp (beta) subunit (PCNA family)
MFKFVISSDELKNVLDVASSVIMPKNMLPILSKVLITKQGDDFFAVGSSSENELTVPFASLQVAKGDFEAFCISPDISKVLGTLGMQPLTVTIDDHNAKMEYQNGAFDVPVEGSENYPRMQTIKVDGRFVAFDADTIDLFPTINRASSCAVKGDTIRPVMSAVLIDATNDGYVIVATDGHKLYKRSTLPGVPFLTAGSPMQLLLLHSAIRPLIKAFCGVETVHIEADNRAVHFFSGGTSMYITTIEGHYPNYNVVFPKQQDYHVVVDVKMLVSALKRIVMFSSTQTSLICLKCEKDGELSLFSQDLDFARSSKETLQCVECTLPVGFQIGLKGVDFISMLSLTTTDNVRLMMSDPSKVITMKEEDPKSSLALLQMPLLLAENA